MRPGIALIASCVLASSAVAQPLSMDKPSLELVTLFAQACAQTHTVPAAVQAWAQAHNLPELTAPDGLAFFADTSAPDLKGMAWMFNSEHTQMVLATRAFTHVCALYAKQADPDQLTAFYRANLANFLHAGSKIISGPDFTFPTAYGMHDEHFAFVTLPNSTVLTFAVLTYQLPGGPYRAAMWEGVTGSVSAARQLIPASPALL